jgi:uncharacterized protein involved in outer membrane biogenesis
MRWKWIPITFGLLLIVILGTVYLISVKYDYNKLKPRIVRMVRDATGRDLKLGGNIEVAFGFLPKLVVTNVSFGNAAWGSQPAMIKVERLEAQARLLPLLLGHVELLHMGISGVDMLLETDPTGRGNWDLAPDHRSATNSGGFKVPRIDVASIRIENLRITFRNGATGSETRSSLARLELENQETLHALSLDLRADYYGQPVALSGKIGQISVLLAGQRFPVDLSGQISNAAFEISGTIEDVLHLTGIDLKVRTSGKNLWGLGLVRGNHLPETKKFDAEGHLTGSRDALALEDFVGNLSGGGIDLTISGAVGDLLGADHMDLHVEASGTDLAEVGPFFDVKLPETEPFTVEGRLTGSAKTLSLQDAQGSARKGTLRVDLKGGIKDLIALSGMDLQVKASGTDLAEVGPFFDVKLPETEPFTVEGRLTGSAKTLSFQDAQVSARKGTLRVDLKGGIKDLIALSGMDLQMKASGKELAEVGPLLDTKIPQLGPFNLSGRLTGSKSSFSFDVLSAIVDQSDFQGHGTVALQNRPKITLALESSVVDFTRIMNSLEGEKQVPGPGQESKRERHLFSDDPIPFAFLRQLDADIELKARNIHARDARFKLGHLTLKLDDGRLDVDPVEATYQEAKFRGSFRLDPNSEPHLSTDFLVQNLDIGNCLKEMGGSDQVQGKVDIAVNVESKGNSVHALMANLDGKVGAVMGKGYMAKFLDLLAMDLSRRVIPFWGKPREAGRIKCAVVDFDIKSGVATSEAFVFNTKVAILRGEGDIDLRTEQVNFLLVPKPKKPSLVSLATNLRVSGSIVDPKVRPDTVSLLTKGAKFLSTLAIGPLGLLVPFVNLGANQKHPCDILGTEELKQMIPSNP